MTAIESLSHLRISSAARPEPIFAQAPETTLPNLLQVLVWPPTSALSLLRLAWALVDGGHVWRVPYTFTTTAVATALPHLEAARAGHPARAAMPHVLFALMRTPASPSQGELPNLANE